MTMRITPSHSMNQRVMQLYSRIGYNQQDNEVIKYEQVDKRLNTVLNEVFCLEMIVVMGVFDINR